MGVVSSLAGMDSAAVGLKKDPMEKSVPNVNIPSQLWLQVRLCPCAES